MSKLKSALSKLTLPGFKACDDTVLQKLYDQLCFSPTEDYIQQQQLLEVLVPWLSDTVDQWMYVTEEVKGFVLRIIAHIAKESKGFTLLDERNILSVHRQIRGNLKDQKNVVILSYIDVVYNLLSHVEGRRWIIAEEVWKEITKFSLQNQNIYIRRRSNELISNFIVTVGKINKDLVHQVMEDALWFEGNQSKKELITAYEIQSPCVFENKYKNIISLHYKENKLNQYKLISEVLLRMLNSGYSANVIKELFEPYRLQDAAWTEIHNGDDFDIILAASKHLCVWSIATVPSSHDYESKKSERKFTCLIMRHFNLLIIRHLFPKVMLETCVEYSTLWYKCCDNFDRVEDTNFKMENLIFIVQAFPMFICIRYSTLEKSEITELFVDKLFKVSCPALIRLCYSYRDHLDNSQLSLERITCQVINSFIRISTFCEKEQAVMIFQALLHLLKGFTESVALNDSQNTSMSSANLIRSYPELLSALLCGLTCYLTKFKFSWRDSLETIGMMCFIQGLITNPDVPFLICAEALKLAKLVLLYFIPPNLALLVDTLQGSSMRDLGNQLFKTLGSVYWEVRDSSLEVLQVIAYLAEDKFPAFQALLLENHLPNIILSIVETDCDSYVRASALSCLTELVKVQIVWDSYLQKEQNLNLFLSLLYFETEGIVRHKAALLIKDIYNHRSIPEKTLELVFNALYHAAQNDLHWEVKVSALEFWDAVKDKCFVSVGMIDGSFPDVIFSKEKKKIIRMTPNEMRMRVIGALNELSNNGCLQSLWETLHDDCDVEVQRKSAFIIKNLVGVINSFGILNNLEDEFISNCEQNRNNGEGDYDVLNKEVISTEDTVFKLGPSLDDIIDEIVAENDFKLLSGLVQLSAPVKSWPKVNRISMSPTEFLFNIKSLDLNNYERVPSKITQHSWDLESILDDILLSNKQTETMDNSKNAIDCY